MKKLFILLSLLSLTACSMSYGIKPVSNAGKLKADEIIVVVKFEVLPHIKKDEQAPHKPSFSNRIDYTQAILPIITDKYYEFHELPVMWTRMAGVVKDGKFAFLKIKKRDRNYLSGAYVYLKDSTLLLDGGLYFDTDDKSKAYYLGTVQYKRNKDNEIIDAKVIDEYASAKRAFASSVSKSVALKKAIFKPIE